ncbi:MAG: tetratricopeptide repeat protein [Acidimicrobiales bacterium]
MFDDGHGVPQDYAEAVGLYRKAAEQGHARAQYNLGIMYAKGQGVAQDYVQAHMWSNLATAGYPLEYTEPRKSAVDFRDRLAAKMTPPQLAEAQRLAREWKPK